MSASEPINPGATSDFHALRPAAPQQLAGQAIERWAKPSETYASKLAATQDFLQQISARYQSISLACSLGAEDMVLLDLIDQLQLPCRVFVLQTGKLNPETLTLLEQVQASYGQRLNIRSYEPDAKLAAAFEQEHGMDAMYRSVELRKQCCHIRKMLPLQQALQGQRAWITGLRREQSSSRAQLSLHEVDGEHDDGHGHIIERRHKFNPLLDWTWGDIWHYLHIQQVPYNPLHDAFYPSIGCQPCTRAITLGEDLRAGRWWWESSSLKECGLHVKT